MMTPDPKFKERMEASALLTDNDLAILMQQIWVRYPKIHAALAEGPVSRRWDCGICMAFGGKTFYMPGGEMDDLPVDHPLSLLYNYHEVPKLKMKHRDQNYYGDLANEIFERCIKVYRAAGYTGPIEEPNA